MSVNEKMTAIADAIRAQTGGTEPLGLDAMAEAIAAIKGGGIGELEHEVISGSFVLGSDITGTDHHVRTGMLSTDAVRSEDCFWLVFLDEEGYVSSGNRDPYEFMVGMYLRNIGCNYSSSDSFTVGHSWWRSSSVNDTTPTSSTSSTYFGVSALSTGIEGVYEYGIKIGCKNNGPQLKAGKTYTWAVIKRRYV